MFWAGTRYYMVTLLLSTNGVAAKKLIFDSGLKLGLNADVIVTTLAVSAVFFEATCALTFVTQKAVIYKRNLTLRICLDFYFFALSAVTCVNFSCASFFKSAKVVLAIIL